MNDIEHELKVAASREACYRAFTTVEGIRGWWCTRCDEVGTAVGERHELKFHKGDQVVVMKFVTEVLEPSRQVTWRCTENGNPAWVGSRITWKISPADGGSRIQLLHQGFAMGGPPYDMTVQGWGPFVKSLQAYLDTGAGRPS